MHRRILDKSISLNPRYWNISKHIWKDKFSFYIVYVHSRNGYFLTIIYAFKRQFSLQRWDRIG